MQSSHAELTISAVASRTGVGVATLRSWEQRYGFPVPVRLPSGHRRFTAEQVDQILEVVRDRDAGMSLEAAVSRVRSRSQRLDSSIFAGLRRRWPQLPSHQLAKRTMLAISRAIEDECCAQAERPVLVASFQQERFYRQSEGRWRDLARTAAVTVVLADFALDRIRRRGPIELGLPDDAPLLREWAVVCDAPDAAACLAGIERLGGAASGRRFEAMWSVDPLVVRDAVAIAAGIVRRPDGSLDIFPDAPPVTDFSRLFERATSVTNRIVAYLDS